MENNESLDIESLFRSSYNALCYFSYQFLSDKDAAEDLVQDAFLRLHNSKEEFSNSQAAKSFLYTCVRNAALNRIRHEKVHEKFIHHFEGQTQNEDYILRNIIQSEILGRINQAIESLPDGCQRVFKMGYLEEFKNQEIAEKLGVSINTIKTQKKRALQLLRMKLKDIRLLVCILITLLQSAFKFIL